VGATRCVFLAFPELVGGVHVPPRLSGVVCVSVAIHAGSSFCQRARSASLVWRSLRVCCDSCRFFLLPACSAHLRVRLDAVQGTDTFFCGAALFAPCASVAVALGNNIVPIGTELTIIPTPSQLRGHISIVAAPAIYRISSTARITTAGVQLGPDCDRFPAACSGDAPAVTIACPPNDVFCLAIETSGFVARGIGFVNGSLSAFYLVPASRATFVDSLFTGFSRDYIFSAQASSYLRFDRVVFANNRAPASVRGKTGSVVLYFAQLLVTNSVFM
jgi:hypothetical protein